MTLRTAVEYVAAAYLLAWLAILVYMLLIGQKLQRLETELARVEQALAARDAASAAIDETAASR